MFDQGLGDLAPLRPHELPKRSRTHPTGSRTYGLSGGSSRSANVCQAGDRSKINTSLLSPFTDGFILPEDRPAYGGFYKPRLLYFLRRLNAHGWQRWLGDPPGYSRIGDSAPVLTAGQWEPDSSRGSSPVLRELGGAIPPGHLTSRLHEGRNGATQSSCAMRLLP
jgi:hypothetical protein